MPEKIQLILLVAIAYLIVWPTAFLFVCWLSATLRDSTVHIRIYQTKNSDDQ